MALTANHFHLNLLLRLYRQATHDQLTGLLNRHALLDLMDSQEQNEARGHPMGIMLIDLDHIKKINDTYGHAVGLEDLRRFADLLRTLQKPTDGVGRNGGEEVLSIIYACIAYALHG